MWYFQLYVVWSQNNLSCKDITTFNFCCRYVGYIHITPKVCDLCNSAKLTQLNIVSNNRRAEFTRIFFPRAGKIASTKAEKVVFVLPAAHIIQNLLCYLERKGIV